MKIPTFARETCWELMGLQEICGDKPQMRGLRKCDINIVSLLLLELDDFNS